MLIETHAHLDFPDFDPDREEILERARNAGVEHIITIGTTSQTSKAAVDLAARYPGFIYATVGIHPNHAREAQESDFLAIEELSHAPGVVAIGETGLDYHYLPGRRPRKGDVVGALLAQTTETVELAAEDGEEIAAQKASFEFHLDLASRRQLNIVIHQRDAFSDTIEFLQSSQGSSRCVFHCFGGSPSDAEIVLGMGHFISFTGIVTFKNAGIVRETVHSLPNDSFFLETDCPYLAPAPYRGKRCEPAFVAEIASEIAKIRDTSKESIAQMTSAAAKEFFKLPG
jgi:TatD DNase family protein